MHIHTCACAMYNIEEVVTCCLYSYGTNALLLLVLVAVIRRLAAVVGTKTYAIIPLVLIIIIEIMIKQFTGKYFIIVDKYVFLFFKIKIFLFDFIVLIAFFSLFCSFFQQLLSRSDAPKKGEQLIIIIEQCRDDYLICVWCGL